MRLQLFRSLWTNGFDLAGALVNCREGTFNGIEGPVPEETSARELFCRTLLEAGIPFIAEITTGGGYVPTTRDPAKHFEDLQRKIDDSVECRPEFITVLAGCDSWSSAQSIDFFGRALDLANNTGLVASFETHRSRSTFNPWITRDLLKQLPALRLTCDFSHWCCVCERLVLDEEPELMELCAARTQHIHARVGYEQGPQVPHPAAPEYQKALAAHERWWQALWTAARDAGRDRVSMTPEFGPDGYLHTVPFANTAVADLDAINHWMARRCRTQFRSSASDTVIRHPL